MDLTKSSVAYNQINYKNILIQRRKHNCFKYNKNVKYDVIKDIQKKDEIKNKTLLENQDIEKEEDDYFEKMKKYKKMRDRKIVSNYYNNGNKFHLNNKDNFDDIDDFFDIEENEKLAKYLSKEFINYSKYRIDNLRLSRLPSKINEDQ